MRSAFINKLKQDVTCSGLSECALDDKADSESVQYCMSSKESDRIISAQKTLDSEFVLTRSGVCYSFADGIINEMILFCSFVRNVPAIEHSAGQRNFDDLC